METICRVKKGNVVEKLLILKISAGDCRVYVMRGGAHQNWGVTVGRKFLSASKAAEFLKSKGWVLTKDEEINNG